MCRIIFLIVLVWCGLILVSPVVHAQGIDKSYLPLALDNEWTYYALFERPGAPPDTSIGNPLRITESIELAGQMYFLYPQSVFFGLDTLRTDAEGRVFAWHDNEEVLLFDFTLPDSAVYSFEEPRYPADEPFEVTVTKNVTVDILGGRFLNCIDFYFDMPRTLDEAQRFTFYPGVGLVRHIGGMGQVSWLFEAIVDGQIVTAIEANHELDSFAVEAAFPNPFRDTTTLRFSTERGGYATVKVYDLLGRKVATLLDGFVGVGSQRVIWDGREQPAGMYIVRLQVGGTVQSIPLVKVH